jgi:hypothetical protein
MLIDLEAACRTLEALPVGRFPAFQKMHGSGRLRCKGDDGLPDYMDDLSSRLAIAALQTVEPGALLIVFPDQNPRRAAIVFTTTLVLNSLARLKAKARFGTVLYISTDPSVRGQLQNITLGGLGLGTIFTQHITRGDGKDVKAISTPGGLHLPRVFIVGAPADPSAILHTQKPIWTAVDLADGASVDWIRRLLPSARNVGVPLVGWVSSPFSGLIDEWERGGGSVFIWPPIRNNNARILAPVLRAHVPSFEFVPRVFMSETAIAFARCFAAAIEALLASRADHQGRLVSDTIAIAWRLLRTLEGMPVRLDDYEREAVHHWGTPRVEVLFATLRRFIDALGSNASVTNALEGVLRALDDIRAAMQDGLAPQWDALANLCVNASAPQTLVFATRNRKEIFRQCMLTRFNVTEDDLESIGTRLAHLSQSQRTDERSVPILVGLPNGERARFLSRYLHSKVLGVLVWPHQQAHLASQVRHLAAKLECSARAAHVALAGLGRALAVPSTSREGPIVRLSPMQPIAAVRPSGELQVLPDTVEIWRRPDLAEAVAALMREGGDEDDDLPTYVPTDDQNEDVDRGTDLWVSSVVELTFGPSRRLLLATDETLNVVTYSLGRPQLEERYARGLRAGDEIVLILGQQRHTLYQLLVSRVHRVPVIAQYLQLVQRWQDDFARAYAEAQVTRRMNEEGLLLRLQALGSDLTSPQTIRTWVRRSVLAPNDASDLLRVARVLSMPFVETYYKQIHLAGRRLKGLHINLSTRLNRWLASGDAAAATEGMEDDLVDAELGLSVDDFRHSLLRLTVSGVRTLSGRYYRGSLGRMEEGE